MSASISAIMVSYHTGPALWLAIEHMLEQAGLAELIVVNNGNPPEVLERLRRFDQVDGRFRLIDGHGNVGFAKGCNIGADAAKGEYIALVNPDSLMPAGGLQRLTDVLRANPDAAVCGGRLIHADRSEQVGGRRALMTPLNAASEMLGLYRMTDDPRFRRLNWHTQPVPEAPIAVPCISGACMVMKREFYYVIGRMDEGYFLHVEDVDFCLRVNESGREILFVPDVEVIHFLSTSEVPSWKVERWKCQSLVRYFERHFDDKISALWWLPLYTMIWGGFLFKMLLGYGRRFLPGSRRIALDHATRRLLLLHGVEDINRKTNQFPYEMANAPEQEVHDPVLITGSSSQVGIAVMRRLLAEGATVLAMEHHTRMPFDHPKLHWVSGDVRITPLPEDGRTAELAIHCAPIWLLKKEQIDLMAKGGVKRLIAFSSTSGKVKQDSANAEERRLAESLIMAESVVMECCANVGIACTIFQPTMIYGFHLDQNVSRISRMIARFGLALLHQPADGMRRPVHVDDLARAVLSVVNNPNCHGKSYVLSGGEALPYDVMVRRIADTMGHSVTFLRSAYWAKLIDSVCNLLPGPKVNGEMMRRMAENLDFSHAEAAKDFGYHPRNFAPTTLDLPWPRRCDLSAERLLAEEQGAESRAA